MAWSPASSCSIAVHGQPRSCTDTHRLRAGRCRHRPTSPSARGAHCSALHVSVLLCEGHSEAERIQGPLPGGRQLPASPPLHPHQQPAWPAAPGAANTLTHTLSTRHPFCLLAPLQGLGATILRNTPANSVYLGSFELLKQEASRRLDMPVAKLPAWAVIGSAGVGGILYW
jgi:hypothetical protein